MTGSKKIQFTILAVLISAFAFVTFYHLGSRPLIDYDESIYAQVARESLQNGNQLGFTWLGNIALHRSEMWFEKPPLMIWLVEISYSVFGVNEFAARFWTAVFAVLTLPLVFFFARKLSQSFTAAILAVAAFFVAFQFDDFAAVLQLDVPVGFFVLLALFSFWQAKENNKFHFLFWTALGFGVMIKSVIELLPLPIVLVFSVLAKDFGWLKERNFWSGILLFLAIVLPWHIIESVRYGKSFWQQYLFYHLLQRYSSTLEGNGGPFFFYADIVFRQTILFWSLMLSLIWFIARSFKSLVCDRGAAVYLSIFQRSRDKIAAIYFGGLSVRHDHDWNDALGFIAFSGKVPQKFRQCFHCRHDFVFCICGF